MRPLRRLEIHLDRRVVPERRAGGPAGAFALTEAEPERPAAAAGGGTPRGSLARNAFNLVLGQVATMALGIVLTAALARSLGVQDFGVYYLITTMSTFAYVLAEWGQFAFVIREVAREPERTGDLLGSALALRAIFALGVTVPAGLVAAMLGYGPRTMWLAVFFILANLPLFLAQGYGMVFRAHDQMGRDAIVSVANKVVALGVSLAALALGLGIPGVIVAQALAGAMGLGVAVKLYRGLHAPSLRASIRTARELLVAGVPLVAMTATISVQPYLDAIILTKLAPAHVVGWFGAARGLLGTLTAPAVILGQASYPRIARVSADTALLRVEARAALRPLLWLAALAGTGTYLFAKTAIQLVYGSHGFEPAATILEVFAPGLFLLFIDILLGNITYASGGGTIFVIGKIASVIVGTGLDIVLIPLFQERYGNGGIGVVVAFALSEFVVFAGALIGMRRGVLDFHTVLDAARALGAAAITILVFRWIPPFSPWIGIPLCVVLFAGLSVALGLVGARDLAALRGLLRRPGAQG